MSTFLDCMVMTRWILEPEMVYCILGGISPPLVSTFLAFLISQKCNSTGRRGHRFLRCSLTLLLNFDSVPRNRDFWVALSVVGQNQIADHSFIFLRKIYIFDSIVDVIICNSGSFVGPLFLCSAARGRCS